MYGCMYGSLLTVLYVYYFKLRINNIPESLLIILINNYLKNISPSSHYFVHIKKYVKRKKSKSEDCYQEF